LKTYGTGLRDPHYLEGVARREWEEAQKAHQEARRREAEAWEKYQAARMVAAAKSRLESESMEDEP
jgi:hypothetical protein